MYNLEELNNSFIISPSIIKKEILNQMNNTDKLYNITFMSIDSLYTSLTFDITYEMIHCVMKNYDIVYDVAKTYLINLKNIYLIKDIEKYNDKKIVFLLQLKKYLVNKNFIKQTNILKYYNKYNFKIIGYNYIEKKYLNAIELLNNKQIIYNSLLNKKRLFVYEFKTIEDEINYTFIEITKLLKQGININNIIITGVNSDYYFLLKKFSKLYHLPITIENENNIYNTNIGKQFIKSIKNNNYIDYLDSLKLKQPNYYNILVGILNEFTFIDNYNEILNILINKLKLTYITNNYIDDIKVKSLDNIMIDDEYHVFVLGLNQGKIPHIMKDEDYLSDEIKYKLNLSTTVELNKANKEDVIHKLSVISNLYLSYANASTFSSLLPSGIIKEYNMTVINNHEFDYGHSELLNKYALTDHMDNFIKYGIISDELLSLYKTYGNNNYDSYDNSFKGINKELLKDRLNNKVSLSYTSLDKYNKCKFMYYIDYILKLNIFEDTFSTNIGKIFHEVLSYAFYEPFDFEQSFEQSKNKEFPNPTPKESFLLIKLKDELLFIINSIKEQLHYINYDQLLTEEEVKIIINDSCKIEFKGIIDKLLFKEYNGVTYVAVVDYKTGKIDTNINNNKYGLNLQLPIYIYLAKRSKLPNVCVTGFYYQTILQNEVKAEDEEDYINKKQQYMKLQGYTVDIADVKIKFDQSENESVIIKSLRRKNNRDFDSRSKVLNLFQLNELEKLVEQNILKAGNNIMNGDFKINPLMIGEKNKSCEFCKYRDLCFRKDKDITKLPVVKDLSFLGE